MLQERKRKHNSTGAVPREGPRHALSIPRYEHLLHFVHHARHPLLLIAARQLGKTVLLTVQYIQAELLAWDGEEAVTVQASACPFSLFPSRGGSTAATAGRCGHCAPANKAFQEVVS